MTTSSPRFYALIYTSFAGIGLLLASVGIAGVAAHNVVRRTQEIGVRLALGGTAGRVVGMVARQALGPIVVAMIAGLAGSALLTTTLAQLLFDIKPHDPLTYAAVVALLGAVALVATWLPARRAARVNPIEVLRAE
jgi:ABC-type antimicrobial peptide transport system permease subunit